MRYGLAYTISPLLSESQLYDVRSAAVHRGRISATKKFRAGTIEDLLKAGFALAAQAITTFLQTGEPQKDDWTKIILA